MDIWQFWNSLLLGVIEGVTEFFPVSSTGHLIIAEKLLGITEPSLFFNVVIQLGAILAVVVFFWKRIVQILQSFVSPVSTSQKKTWMLFVAGTIPVLIIGALFHSTIERLQASVHVVTLATFLIAFILVWAEKKLHHTLVHGVKKSTLKFWDYIVVGIFQAISVIPGVSRSGITIVGALTRKLSFDDAVETAFILGIPAMGAAAVFESLKLIKEPAGLTTALLMQTAVGFIAAFITAFFTISATLPLLKKYGFTPFVIYRIALAILLLFLFPLAL